MKNIIKQSTEYSNLSQWIQMEIFNYFDRRTTEELCSVVADRIIKRVLEDKNLVNNKIHKEGYDAGYKKGRKYLIKQIWKNYVGSDLERFLSANYEAKLFDNFLQKLSNK